MLLEDLRQQQIQQQQLQADLAECRQLKERLRAQEEQLKGVEMRHHRANVRTPPRVPLSHPPHPTLPALPPLCSYSPAPTLSLPPRHHVLKGCTVSHFLEVWGILAYRGSLCCAVHFWQPWLVAPLSLGVRLGYTACTHAWWNHPRPGSMCTKPSQLSAAACRLRRG